MTAEVPMKIHITQAMLFSCGLRMMLSTAAAAGSLYQGSSYVNSAKISQRGNRTFGQSLDGFGRHFRKINKKSTKNQRMFDEGSTTNQKIDGSSTEIKTETKKTP